MLKISSLSLIASLSFAPAALSAAPSSKATDEAKKPLNVILIMSDDQGYGDVGYMGNREVKTPELDKLYSQSICLTNFHTGTTSAPTRSGLMTGRYGNSVGVWHTIQGRSIMRGEEYTMAELFRDNGYSTAMFGKWHLGDNYPSRPFDQGFDDVLWHKAGGVGQTPDYWGNTYFDDVYFRNAEPEQQYGYCTDIWFNEAERFIVDNQENPFFCYLSLNAPHGPFNVDERYAAEFRGVENVPSAPYYGMIKNMDDNIGRLRSVLERLGLDENTVIIFFGDNGSGGVVLDKQTELAKVGYNGGLRGKKGSPYEGGHAQALLMHIPGCEVQEDDMMASYVDVMPTLAALCSLTPALEVSFDGADILSESTPKDRVFVVDTQREEYLQEDRMFCVAKGDWRLVGKKLYNLKDDRGQQSDIARSYPEVVDELYAEYKKWWQHTAANGDVISYIPLVTNVEGESVDLTCHDLHDDLNGSNVWNQTLLHTNARPTTGYWTVSSPKSYRYNIELYRWSPESGLGYWDAAPEGRFIPNGERYAACDGGVANTESVTIKIDGKLIASQEVEVGVPIKLADVKIPKGDHKIEIHLKDSEGAEFSPWFVRFDKQ
ncbi:MAG: arylsulfatase [Rikenellaceae bacterium]